MIDAEENENVEEKDESSKSSSNESSFTTALHILCNETYHLLRMLSQNCAKFMALYALFLCTAERVLKRVKTRYPINDGAGKTRGIAIHVCGRKDLAYLAT